MSYCNHFGHEGQPCPNYVTTPMERIAAALERIADNHESIVAAHEATALIDRVERAERDALQAKLDAVRELADELRDEDRYFDVATFETARRLYALLDGSEG